MRHVILSFVLVLGIASPAFAAGRFDGQWEGVLECSGVDFFGQYQKPIKAIVENDLFRSLDDRIAIEGNIKLRNRLKTNWFSVSGRSSDSQTQVSIVGKFGGNEFSGSGTAISGAKCSLTLNRTVSTVPTEITTQEKVATGEANVVAPTANPPPYLLSRANAGDASAEHDLGDYYLRLGDMKSAVRWYRKAAQRIYQSSWRDDPVSTDAIAIATYKLSVMLERGIGVQADVLLARRLKLQADTVRSEISIAEYQRFPMVLERQLELAEGQSSVRDKAVVSAEAESKRILEEAKRAAEAERSRLLADARKAAEAESKRILDEARKAAEAQLLAAAEQSRSANLAGTGKAAKEKPFVDIDFGNYYALVIGNNEYEFLADLQTAEDDAKAVAAILEDRYGFTVELLLNATRGDVFRALGNLRRKLTESDNLLIYYAGHGVIDEAAERGYWLPVDSEEDFKTNWISTVDLSDTLRAIDAWHVMVVADSCYSGTLIRSAQPVVQLGGDKVKLIERLTLKKSRTVLTSGGVEPVADSGGGGHSVFAKAFLDVLRENTEVIEAQRLFISVRTKVVVNADQTPEYAEIRKTGHDGGDFLFVPR